MAQSDMDVANATFPATRTDINAHLAALVSNSSGLTEPATMFAFQWWADTTSGLLKIRNSANTAWVTVGTLATLNLGLANVSGSASQNFSAQNLNASLVNELKGADIASAATVNLDNATGGIVDVTGVTAITAITLSEGRERTVRFTGALTLTHGASLVLPGTANITTAAGDFAIFRGYAAGVVRCVLYTKADGKPVVGANKLIQVVNTQTGAVATGTTIIDSDDTIPQNTEGDEYMTLAITPNNVNNKLLIMSMAFLSSNGAGPVITGALFQDTTLDALAVQVWHANATGTMHSLDITHFMTAGTVAATTFKFRAGAHVAGTTTFNGRDGLRRYGGRIASSITIMEIAA